MVDFEDGFGNSVTKTPTLWVKSDLLGNKVSWTGTGFSYDNAGWISTGLATAITFSDASGNVLYTVTLTTPWNFAGHTHPIIDDILANNDTITGAGGNDVLAGGVGKDKMIGGAGDDYYLVDSSGDVIIEGLRQGDDWVMSNVTYTLPANTESLLLGDANPINGYGNALDNTLSGNSGANVLTGYAGKDYLDGNLGKDTLIGGLGNDIYSVDNIGDKIIENLNQGYDSVSSNVSYVLPAHVEQLQLNGKTAINGTGNAIDNILSGNEGNNKLNGEAGNDYLFADAGIDTLIGGLGDDSYDVSKPGSTIIELSNQGTDTVWSTLSYTLPAHVEQLGLYGTSVINGTGNNLNNKINGNETINVLQGKAGNDFLKGFGGADVIQADAGNDTLDGGNGKDILTGGTGKDVFQLTTQESVDTIADFLIQDDTLQLENSVFTRLTATGQLTTSMFRSGAGVTTAADTNDYVIYNNTSGKLYYDADANGASVPVQIALIGTTTHAALNVADFVVI